MLQLTTRRGVSGVGSEKEVECVRVLEIVSEGDCDSNQILPDSVVRWSLLDQPH